MSECGSLLIVNTCLASDELQGSADWILSLEEARGNKRPTSGAGFRCREAVCKGWAKMDEEAETQHVAASAASVSPVTDAPSLPVC